jgi:hypothetical protein
LKGLSLNPFDRINRRLLQSTRLLVDTIGNLATTQQKQRKTMALTTIQSASARMSDITQLC